MAYMLVSKNSPLFPFLPLPQGPSPERYSNYRHGFEMVQDLPRWVQPVNTEVGR